MHASAGQSKPFGGTYWTTVAGEGAEVQSIIAYSGELIPLSIASISHLPECRFVLVYDLPNNFRLTAGMRSGKVWMLSSSDAAGLQIRPSENYTGSLMLQFLCFRDIGKAPIVINVRVEPRASAQKGPDSAAALPPLPSALQISASEEAALLGRADEFRFNGDIATARLFYGKLAAMGSEKGAMSMAQSFDSLFLKSFLLTGVAQPDIAKAKHWYEVAKKLGSREANERLQALWPGPTSS